MRFEAPVDSEEVLRRLLEEEAETEEEEQPEESYGVSSAVLLEEEEDPASLEDSALETAATDEGQILGEHERKNNLSPLEQSVHEYEGRTASAGEAAKPREYGEQGQPGPQGVQYNSADAATPTYEPGGFNPLEEEDDAERRRRLAL
jgi:hypothetical protein